MGGGKRERERTRKEGRGRRERREKTRLRGGERRVVIERGEGTRERGIEIQGGE